MVNQAERIRRFHQQGQEVASNLPYSWWPSRRLGRRMEHKVESERVCAAGLLGHCGQSDWKYWIWTRWVVHCYLENNANPGACLEFTDAITRDWGGKPFVDLREGWKYALKHYPVSLNYGMSQRTASYPVY